MALLKSMSSGIVPRVGIGLFEELLADYPKRDFRIRFWDGTTWGTDQQPRFTLLLKHPAALWDMLLSPSELTLSEAYIYDDFEIEGDLEAAIDVGEYLFGRDRGVTRGGSLATLLRRLPLRNRECVARQPPRPTGPLHSKDRDRQVLAYHYDRPSEFYALWLDRRMVYSCAYFDTEQDDLDLAQERKMDYICRKLRLHSGEHLLDMGCGWGGLVIHAAARYGVRALGITCSAAQAEIGRQRIREAGVEDRCRIEVCDYRDLEPDPQYDKIASVEMFESVGEAVLPEYFGRVWQSLRPGGAFLNQGIAYSATCLRARPTFSDRYVFPDGELVPISASLRAAEMCGFEVRDLESLREHYVLTLRQWVRRLEAKAVEARRVTDDLTYRIWRLYMAGSAHGFHTGRLNVYQALLVRPLRETSGQRLTHADWGGEKKSRSVEATQRSASSAVPTD